ncbi:MAG: hypothetical protein ABL882_05855 [Sphingopyxis sp.]
MFFAWGSAGKSVFAGPAGQGQCGVCNAERNFSHYITYVMRHLWYIIRWPTGTKYLRVCDHCGNGQDIGKAGFDAERTAGLGPEAKALGSPIPFLDRFGWAIAIGTIALLIGIVAIVGSREDAADTLLVDAPRAGDLYVVNMQQMFPDVPSSSVGADYGVLRVAAVTAAGVKLDLPQMVSSRISGAQKDVDGRGPQNPHTDAYYDGQVEMPLSELRSRNASGAIDDVVRP